MFSLQEYVRNPEAQARIGLKVLSMDEIKKIQERLLDIYKDVMYVCEKYNLRIMLGGGSALGAVRHAGFIPWDDDMDLMMPRADFDRFVHSFSIEFDEKYQLLSPVSKRGNVNYFICVIDRNSTLINLFDKSKRYHNGICVEITPIDYIPKNKIIKLLKGIISDALLFAVNSRMMFNFRNRYSDKLFFSRFKSSVVYTVRLLIGLFSCVFTYDKLLNFYDAFVRGKSKTKYMTIACGRNHYFGEIQKTEVFFPLKEILFENIKSYVPNQCDIYLKKLYGEGFMQIPPKEKREPHPYIKFEIRDL